MCSRSPISSGENDCVVSAAGLALREQRAAARAVVRGLRVLEAALRAVDDAHAGRRRLARQDLRQAVDVDLVEHAAPAGALQPRDELGAQDVDLAVQEAALVADLALLLLEVVDQALQLVVGQRAKIRERFHGAAFRRRWVDSDSSRECRNRQPQVKGSARGAPISSRSITSVDERPELASRAPRRPRSCRPRRRGGRAARRRPGSTCTQPRSSKILIPSRRSTSPSAKRSLSTRITVPLSAHGHCSCAVDQRRPRQLARRAATAARSTGASSSSSLQSDAIAS